MSPGPLLRCDLTSSVQPFPRQIYGRRFHHEERAEGKRKKKTEHKGFRGEVVLFIFSRVIWWGEMLLYSSVVKGHGYHVFLEPQRSAVSRLLGQ